MAKDERIEVRLTADEKAAFMMAASKAKKTLSQWLLDLALGASQSQHKAYDALVHLKTPVLDKETLEKVRAHVAKPARSFCFRCSHKHPPAHDCGCDCHGGGE